MKEWFNKLIIKLCCAHKWSIITSIKTPPASGLETDHIRCSEKLFLEILYGTQTNDDHNDDGKTDSCPLRDDLKITRINLEEQTFEEI